MDMTIASPPESWRARLLKLRRITLIVYSDDFAVREIRLLRRGSPESFRGWRRGELNPCPRRYPRKHLHVYPVISFKEPSVAPAHCQLPSVHEFPSPAGAVAPPFD